MTSNDASLLVKNNQTLEVANDGATGANLTVSGGTTADDAANKSATIKLASETYGTVAIDGEHLKTLTLEAAGDLTLADVRGHSGSTDQTVIIKSAGNVVASGSTRLVSNLKTLDASGVAGNLSDLRIDAGVNVLGSAGDNNVTFITFNANSTFVGQDGNDTVELIAVGDGHQTSLVLGGGNNFVQSGDVNGNGVLSVTAGDGDDTVRLINGDFNGTVVLQLGGGTNTLQLVHANLSGGHNVVLDGLDILDIKAGPDSRISAKYLTESSYVVKGEGAGSTRLTIDGSNDDDTINLSGWDVSDSISTGVTITLAGGDGNDTLTGTSVADVIRGGAGADVLTGGGGSNTFVYKTVTDSSLTSLDHITDLVLNGSAGDKIELTKIAGTAAAVGTEAQAAGVALSALDAATVHALLKVTDGSLAHKFAGAGNTNAALLTTTDEKTLLVVDVDGDGAFDASDLIVNVTGVTTTTWDAGFLID